MRRNLMSQAKPVSRRSGVMASVMHSMVSVVSPVVNVSF